MDYTVILICKFKLMFLNTNRKAGEKVFNIFIIMQYVCP